MTKAAFISREFTVTNRELLQRVRKDLYRELVGPPAWEQQGKDAEFLDRGDSLSLARRWDTVRYKWVNAAEFEGVNRRGMAEPGPGGLTHPTRAAGRKMPRTEPGG